MKLSVRFDIATRTPLRIIEWILSALAIIGGAYVMSPLLTYSTAAFGAGAIAQTIAHPIGIFVFGFLLFASGVTLAIGLVNNNKKWRSAALLLQIICRIYALLGTWITIGLLPLTWLSGAGLLAIAIVIYFVVRRELKVTRLRE
jgi:hypothetical protein